MRLLLVSTLIIFAPYAGASDPRAEITDFFSDLTQALNTRDLAKIENSWAAQGELMTLAGGIYRGSTEIRDIFKEAFDGSYNQASYEHIIQYVRVSNMTATVDGVWRTANGPNNYPDCGIFVYHLVKENGHWKIIFSNSTVPRQGHTAEHGRILSWVETCKK